MGTDDKGIRFEKSDGKTDRGERLNYSAERDGQRRQGRREETIAFPARFAILRYAVFVTLLILGARFWDLQILNHGYFVQASENNRIREIPIHAPRGNILDRNNRRLVDSFPSMNLIILREDIQNEDDTVKVLTDNFGIDRDSLLVQLHDTSVPKSQPIIIKRDANVAD